MKRRTFVQATAAAAGASTVLPGCAALVATPVTPVNGEIRIAVRNYPQLEQPGGFVRLMPAGAEDVIIVLTQDDGSLAVVTSVCTHLECTVNVEGALLVCPCHGSTFDRAGRVLRGPASDPLPRYPATLTAGGELVIRYAGGAS